MKTFDGEEVVAAIVGTIGIFLVFGYPIYNSAYEQGREDGGVHILDVLEQEGYCDRGIKE
jgi:hypothetical protein